MHFGTDLEITLRQSVEHLLTDRIAGDLGLPQGFAVFIDDFQLDVTILFRLEIGGQFSACPHRKRGETAGVLGVDTEPAVETGDRHTAGERLFTQIISQFIVASEMTPVGPAGDVAPFKLLPDKFAVQFFISTVNLA